MPNSYRLVIRSGPTAGKVFPLEKSELFIGRDLNNEIVINDPEVSRRHARLYAQGNSYVLEDLGSTNGTFVGGQRLTGPYPLRLGEVVTFGEKITVVFEVDQEAPDATVVSSAARAVPSQPAVQPVPQPAAQPQFQPPVAQSQPAQPQPVQPLPVQPQQVQPQYQPVQPVTPPQSSYVSQAPIPAQPAYSNQVPYQTPVDAPVKKSNRTLIIILVVLLVVICLCVMIGLFMAPKEFWCLFPIWPAGACS